MRQVLLDKILEFLYFLSFSASPTLLYWLSMWSESSVILIEKPFYKNSYFAIYRLKYIGKPFYKKSLFAIYRTQQFNKLLYNQLRKASLKNAILWMM